MGESEKRLLLLCVAGVVIIILTPIDILGYLAIGLAILIYAFTNI